MFRFGKSFCLAIDHITATSHPRKTRSSTFIGHQHFGFGKNRRQDHATDFTALPIVSGVSLMLPPSAEMRLGIVQLKQ